MKKTVFVSSTWKDLHSHRASVRKVLKDFNVKIKGMEDFGARSRPPIEFCLQEIEKSDIYLGIFSMRYGSIDIETGKSITQLEYEKAIEHGLEILIFLIDEEKGKVTTGNIDFDEKHLKLIDFKTHLKRVHLYDSFIDEQDLALSVYKSMKQYEDDNEYKRPPILYADVLTFNFNSKECNIFISKYDSDPVEIFTVVPMDEYDFIDPNSNSEFKIVSRTIDEETILDLEFLNKKGYKTTYEGFSISDETIFTSFDNFLNTVLQNGMGKRILQETIDKPNIAGYNFEDWKRTLKGYFNQ